MKTVLEDSNSTLIINKSTFDGYVFHVSSEEEFKNKLKEIKSKNYGATHYCYAYKLNNKQKSNDDGEPSSTAGKPILEAILQNNVDNIGIVVIRYFGGIKLGAGGLIRAYSSIANKTIKEAKIVDIIATKQYLLTYEYSYNDLIKRYLESNNIKIIDIKYDVKIGCLIATNEDISKLVDICNGNINIKEKETVDLII